MNREIEFRVWDGRPGKKGWALVYWAEMDDWLEDPQCCVEQFTGLHDKNGKEIYEGDRVTGSQILHPDQQTTDIIEYSERFSCWMLGKGRCLQFYHNLEVIGNIHQAVFRGFFFKPKQKKEINNDFGDNSSAQRAEVPEPDNREPLRNSSGRD